MSGGRAGFAETGPGVPGAGGRYPASLRPRGLPAGKASPDPSRPRGGWPSHRPRGQAHRWDLAGSPRQSRCARGHARAPGEPWTARSACVTGSRARHAPPARMFAPAARAGRVGKVPAAGQL